MKFARHVNKSLQQCDKIERARHTRTSERALSASLMARSQIITHNMDACQNIPRPSQHTSPILEEFTGPGSAGNYSYLISRFICPGFTYAYMHTGCLQTFMAHSKRSCIQCSFWHLHFSSKLL